VKEQDDYSIAGTLNFLSPLVIVVSFVLVLVAIMTFPVIMLEFSETAPEFDGYVLVGSISVILALIGFTLVRHNRIHISSRQLYLMTTMSWGAFALMGAVPLYINLPGLSFADAFFESMSGITTTGSTVLTGLDGLPHSILLWRALLQWFGGIGIIVLGIAILPYLKIGGMRLFSTESSHWAGNTRPRAQVLLKNIGIVYILLTLLAASAYWLAGMSLFDAVTHAMTTVSTGGYSNYDASMGHFTDHPSILWVAIVFMLLGALPFALFVSFLSGRSSQLLTDSQVRGFLAFVVAIVVLLSWERLANSDASSYLAVTHSAFNAISIITTTGYVSDDYTRWGYYAEVAFFYLMFIGGCSGSTSGSIKFFRLQVAAVLLLNQLRIMRHPYGQYMSKYNGRHVTEDILRSIIGFSFFFMLTIICLAFGLSLTGLDFVTSMSAATTCVTNVGPGIGDVVGPSGNFSSLSDAAKWLLSLGMLLGRLEIMTVLVLLTPAFWQRF
jgi:trk system potassium uptake protein TrkH